MNDDNLTERIINNVCSSKVKERQEGFQELSDALTHGRDLQVSKSFFQHIFSAVAVEQTNLKKAEVKGSSSSQTIARRLGEFARVARRLVEETSRNAQSVQLMKKVCEVLLRALSRGERPCPHVGLDFLKALKSVVSHRPHLDHLFHEQWTEAVQLCFNIILERPLKTSLTRSESEKNEVQDSDDEDDELPTEQKGKKRGLGQDSQRDGTPPFKRARLQISVTLEQVECASLLSTLLRSETSPINLGELPSAILRNLQQYGEKYPSESSLLQDYLTSVSHTLDHLAYNHVHDVQRFAQGTWTIFTNLWGVKGKPLKEQVLIILRVLLPFVAPTDCDALRTTYQSGFDAVEAMNELWKVLDAESKTKWGANELEIDSLRLELLDPDNPSSTDIGDNPFVATTFRAGWNFGASQALSWATIELQADCGKHLYQLSERNVDTPRPRNSRTLPTNPIDLLTAQVGPPRPHNLQVLLFFIDRHWADLHDSAKQAVTKSLLEFIGKESVNELTQSWIFLNLAAIAFAEKACVQGNPDLFRLSQDRDVMDANTWDVVWSHAIRRANSPGLCRAACHTAHTLLASLFRYTSPSGHIFLTSQTVLQEIENFGKGLDLQGPAYPFDSVCMFLRKCIQIASQDVRLYRLQLEDKVSNWFADTWTMPHRTTTNAPLLNTPNDLLLLFDTISGLGKQVDMTNRPALPTCCIVDSMKMEKRMKDIRDYVLYAKLSPPPRSQPSTDAPSTQPLVEASPNSDAPTTDVRLDPRKRERKISSFFNRTLSILVDDWEGRTTGSSRPTIETARQFLDLAVTAIAFEATLTLNSTTATKQVMQNAGALLQKIVDFVPDSRWNMDEKLSLILGLESLVCESILVKDVAWSGIAYQDDANDGMARPTFAPKTSVGDPLRNLRTRRAELLRAIWQSSYLQTPFTRILKTIRKLTLELDLNTLAADGADDFAPIRRGYGDASANSPDAVASSLQKLSDVYIPILTRGPRFQSSPAMPTKDRELMAAFIDAPENRVSWFMMVAPTLLQEIQTGTANCDPKQLSSILHSFEACLKNYDTSYSPNTMHLGAQLCQATLGIWAVSHPLLDVEELRNMVVGELVRFLHNRSSREKSSWRARDAFVRLVEAYVTIDPSEAAWREGRRMDTMPLETVKSMVADDDIRVRYSAVTALPKVFTTSEKTRADLESAYANGVRDALCLVPNYERTVTRLLALANLIITSAEIRRGAYWNFLETYPADPAYLQHMQTALKAAVDGLGLPSLTALFKCYGPQLGYFFTLNERQLSQFSPALFGFPTRRALYETAYGFFVPSYVILNANEALQEHCDVLQKRPQDGKKEFFGDTVGLTAAYLFQNRKKDIPSDEVESEIIKHVVGLDTDPAVFADLKSQNLDSIAAAVLRTLKDQDISPTGPISLAISSSSPPDGTAGSVFASLSKYRLGKLRTHIPNEPVIDAAAIVEALAWVCKGLEPGDETEKAMVFHVTHRLFASIEQTPLVNEKYRLFNALCLWIALKNSIFNTPTFLHTLLHGASSLLGQRDLALCAQALLEWVLRSYIRIDAADSRLTPVLVRVCAICHEYALSSDPELAQLGKGLSSWIDQQVYGMVGSRSRFNGLVAMALHAWPRDPMDKLAEFYRAHGTGGDFEKLWKDEHISSGKFRMVRKLNERSAVGNDFATSTFWRLKECIPPSNKLHHEDVLAFTDLLVRNQGHIDSLAADQSSATSIRSRQRRGAAKPRDGIIGPGRDAILWGLVKMLEDDSPTLLHTAYNTLRLMLAVQTGPLPVATSQQPEKTFWDPEHCAELELLKTFPVIPLRRTVPRLGDVLSDEWEEKSLKFAGWVTAFAVLIADVLSPVDPTFGQLYPLLSTDVATAEQILPVLVICLLTADETTETKDILTAYFTKILKQQNASLSTVRCVVDIALHLRYFTKLNEKEKDSLAHNKWLGLKFLLLAESAVRCGAYTTALLFLELEADHPTRPEPNDSQVAERTQYEIYAHIDEPDGFYGIQTQNQHQFLVQRLHHEKQYDKAFRFHGAMLEARPSNPSTDDISGLLQSFHAFGFNNLAINTFQQPKLQESPTDAVINYKLGWRSETWDLPDRDSYCPGAPFYNALRAVYRERDPRMIDSVLRQSLDKEVGQLRSLRIESIAEIREVNQSLMCLNQIFRWRNAFNQPGKKVDIKQLRDFAQIDTDFEFQDLDNVMSTRIALLRSLRQREERQKIGNIMSDLEEHLLGMEKQCLISLSRAARAADQTQVALNCVLRARNLDSSSSPEITQEYAKVLWAMNEPKPAVKLLTNVLEQQLESGSPQLKAALRARLGTWASEACLKKPTEIWGEYFVRAKGEMEGFDSKDVVDAAEVYHQCAEFADKQYHAITNSPEMIRKHVYIERKRQEIIVRRKQMEEIKKANARASIDTKPYTDAQQLLLADEQQYKKLLASREMFLKEAIKLYAKSLALTDSFDDDGPIKLSSLWYANFDDTVIDPHTIQTALRDIPSRKFIFLSHQLAARITDTCPTEQVKNQEALQSLVKRLCLEHPFHSLYQVFSLKADATGAAREPSPTGSISQEDSQAGRQTAADNILDKLKSESSELTRTRVTNVLFACDAYLQWAKHHVSKSDTAPKKDIPSSYAIVKIRDLPIPVLTSDTPIDSSLRYKDFVSIYGYERKFSTAGGVNLPKICICVGSDRKRYKQLFKGQGKDDMRQDAVMEQVFELVNNLLCTDRETSRRTLRVRGYKVIPLGTQAGVLEFVNQTTPLRDWLIKKHKEYHPTDMGFLEASKAISNVSKSPVQTRVKVYTDVCQRFRPVFRHFFTEKHKNPMGWFAMRLRYTRSVATTSIVGHVLGLGDRHTSNILMDVETGEVVHIDLGIAFDQGKLLPVPEKVPFRLTRDIVDGMGTSKTQGVFQRCAEETLRVLREGSDIIMTVLEVFKYDPLHSWTASDIKIQRAQPESLIASKKETARFQNAITIDMDSGSAEEAADRALSSVARKLDKGLSVESAVNELIAEASDVQNLAVIFSGWGPHA